MLSILILIVCFFQLGRLVKQLIIRHLKNFASFSLTERVDCRVSFYNINGDKDYQTNNKLAKEYFEQVNASHKQIYIMEKMTHGLLESDSEGFILEEMEKFEKFLRSNAHLLFK